MWNYNQTPNPDELYHFGIKGMHWGVRRYRNEDGTLTPAGHKRLAKMEAYLNKLSDKARRKSERHTRLAKDAESRVRDLKRNGIKSKEYQEWKQREDRRRANEYERKNSVEVDGKRYVKKYSGSLDNWVNDIGDHVTRNQRLTELTNSRKESAKQYRRAAKWWSESQNKLDNMQVSIDTSKKHIKRAYRNR